LHADARSERRPDEEAAMKCKKGHEMLAKAKHCGECGEGPAEEMVKCAACSTEMTKAAKFCLECGVAAAVPSAALDVALDGLNAFAKAKIDIEKTLADLPEIDEDELDPKAVDEIIKAATVKDDKGNDVGLDAGPVMTEFLKGQNLLTAIVQSYAGHQQKYNAHLADSDTVLLKAVIAIGATVKDLAEKVEKWGAQPRTPGGKSIRDTALTIKSRDGINGTGPQAAALEERRREATERWGEDIPGEVLLAKATAACMRESGLFGPADVAKLEFYKNNGRGNYHSLMQEDAAFAARVRAAVDAPAATGAAVH
jgi:hypothetical protein